MGIAIQSYGYQDHAQSADVIIMLGAGLNRNNTPTRAHVQRARRAAALYRQGIAPFIICTGGMPGYATRSEADACREILLAAGVPADAILLEERSRSTEENALYSKAIMDAHGWTSAVVVSDRYHLLRANWLFTNAGIITYTSPTASSYLSVFQYANSFVREILAFHWQALNDLFGLPFTYVPLV